MQHILDGERGDSKCQYIFLKLLVKCSALKRKKGSAAAFAGLRRCRSVWGRAGLLEAVQQLGVLAML